METLRKLKFSIFRYEPEDPSSKPRMQTFDVEETPGMTMYQALFKIREEQDPSLKFDFVCRASVCGSCAMLINGKPMLGCKTQTSQFKDGKIKLMPLPVFKMLGDLSVDTGTWFRGMTMRTEAWIHGEDEFDPSKKEERMDNATATEIYEGDRCIECGICIAACATSNIREDFIGAAGMNRVARFIMDPRDKRQDDEYFQVIGTEEGVFGCVGLMACNDHCPKEIPLQGQIAYIRRVMGKAAFTKSENTAALKLPTVSA